MFTLGEGANSTESDFRARNYIIACSATPNNLQTLSSVITSPKIAGRPSISTQPALMKSSASRREHMPFIAIKRLSLIPLFVVEFANCAAPLCRAQLVWTSTRCAIAEQSAILAMIFVDRM